MAHALQIFGVTIQALHSFWSGMDHTPQIGVQQNILECMIWALHSKRECPSQHSKIIGVHGCALQLLADFWSIHQLTPTFLEWTMVHSTIFGVKLSLLQHFGVHVVNYWSTFSLPQKILEWTTVHSKKIGKESFLLQYFWGEHSPTSKIWFACGKSLESI